MRAPRNARALLDRLRWTVLRPLATHPGGDERSVLRGPGLELTQVREYQPGDDVRHIDWNVSARSDRTYIRESLVERGLDVWLLLDLSPSLEWGTARCLKSDRAAEAAAAFGHLLGRHGNRLGAMYFAGRPLGELPPSGGRVQQLRVLAGREDEARGRAAKRREPTDLVAVLRRAAAVLRRPALVIVVSDFIVPDGWQAPLGQLARRHEVIAVRLTDPRESELPNIGLVTLEDPETGSQLLVDTGDRRLRERFAAAARDQAERLRRNFTSAGVDELVLRTDEELLPPLVRFLDVRRRRARAHHAA